MDKGRSSAPLGAARSTSQMTLDERREYIAKLRTERQERFGSSATSSAPSSRPSSSQSVRGTEELKRALSPTKELRRSDLQSSSPTPYSQTPPPPPSSSLLGLHNTFQGAPRSSSPIPPSSSSFQANSSLPRHSFSSSTFQSSFTTPLTAPNTNNNNNSFLSSQNFDKQTSGGTNAFSSAFSVSPPDSQASTLDTKHTINSAQRGYNQWAEEKMKWWDAEGKRLQSFLTQMDEEWDRHRDATRRELEDEIAALKHESLVRSNINQASKNLL